MSKYIKGNRIEGKYASTVLDNNNEVFAMRRKVMGYIYEAREALGNMPRITIRIVKHDSKDVMGTAFLGCNFITVSENMAGWNDSSLCKVVYHELAHAWFGAVHNEKSILMSSTSQEHGEYDKQALLSELVGLKK